METEEALRRSPCNSDPVSSPQGEFRKVTRPKVLIVEDSFPLQRFYREVLNEKYTILQAYSVDHGEQLFRKHPDVAAIVMDACVPGHKPTTPPLVRRIRKSYHGPIIAASSDDDFQDALISAGCNHRAFKHTVPDKLAELLDPDR
ncbi:MAG TPA: response regulator [Candidatus Methylomirabilis sp.]|nr:response regulator [Candidatus Methylomirabilis sp.]